MHIFGGCFIFGIKRCMVQYFTTTMPDLMQHASPHCSMPNSPLAKFSSGQILPGPNSPLATKFFSGQILPWPKSPLARFFPGQILSWPKSPLAKFSPGQILPWPSVSPDLNPNKHTWNELERHVQGRVNTPANVRELFQSLKQVWATIPYAIDSQPDPLHA